MKKKKRGKIGKSEKFIRGTPPRINFLETFRFSDFPIDSGLVRGKNRRKPDFPSFFSKSKSPIDDIMYIMRAATSAGRNCLAVVDLEKKGHQRRGLVYHSVD